LLLSAYLAKHRDKFNVMFKDFVVTDDCSEARQASHEAGTRGSFLAVKSIIREANLKRTPSVEVVEQSLHSPLFSIALCLKTSCEFLLL
jgi:hypothetical protein